MSKLTWIAGGAGALVLLAGLAVGGGVVWANSAVEGVFATTWETHEVEFPVPFPLSPEELEALRAEQRTEREAAGLDPDPGEPGDLLAGVDLEALALERAVARGEHFVTSIYACTECHGADFGGGVMLEDGAMGTVKGPNITPGGRVQAFSVADWDRAVRHGVLPGGLTSFMPVGDFTAMSDRELSDIIAYARSVPPLEGGEAVREWGPIGTMLIATGSLMPDVFMITDHHGEHAAHPPEVASSVEYGAHVIQVCTGCHRKGLEGGPMPFGPPDWPPAANLTPHADGLEGWTYDQFLATMRGGSRPDGTALRAPMSSITKFAVNMTDTELEAMWAYLQSVPPTPTPE